MSTSPCSSTLSACKPVPTLPYTLHAAAVFSPLSLFTSSSSQNDAPRVYDFPAEPRLSNGARILSASIGAVITSVVVTPFDVIKTRLQAQSPVGSASAKNAQMQPHHAHTHVRLSTGLVDLWCPQCITMPQHADTTVRFNGSINALTTLIRTEGITSLWRGLSVALVLSIPSTIMYFASYDTIKLALSQSDVVAAAPLIAGTSARALTTIVVSPLEFVRTRIQASNTRSSHLLSMIADEVRSHGLKSLWRGCTVTLWRDVPFSAIYWTSYEQCKTYLMSRWQRSYITDPQLYERALMTSSFLSGAVSGMFAATITHPFDVVKTRRQIDMYALSNANTQVDHYSFRSYPSTLAVIRRIIQDEGVKGLLTGLTARLGKIAPSCAIMISTYEVAKQKFGQYDKLNKSVLITK